MASPQRRGWAANRDQEARLRAPAHRQGERNWSTPSGSDGVAPAATGLAWSAARTRRYGQATSNAAANSGDRQPGARPAYARERSRMRSEEHKSEHQSIRRTTDAVVSWKK